MSGQNESAAARLPDAVQVNVNGLPALYIEITAERAPTGVEVMLSRPGELAPLSRGFLPPGYTLLVIDPQVAGLIRQHVASQLKAARQAGAGGAGIAGG